MANNQITVRQNYEDGKKEYRSSESRYNGLEFYYTEKHISEYTGIDITPENIKILNKKVFEFGLKNVVGKAEGIINSNNVKRFISSGFWGQENSEIVLTSSGSPASSSVPNAK